MNIYRGSKKLATLSLDQSSCFRQSLLGEDIVECHCSLEDYFAFEPGDYLLYRGRSFSLLSAPSVNKMGSVSYDYNLTFYSSQYKLQDALFCLDGNSSFSLYAEAKKALELLVINLQRVFPEDNWQLGACEMTSVKSLSFSDENCLFVLQKLCKEFALEFDIESDLEPSGDEGARARIAHKLHLKKKIGKDTGIVLKFKKGLRGIERMRDESKGIITRLYPYGSSKNLPHPYRSGKNRLALEEGFLEKNLKSFGLIEGVKQFEELYPKREGTVSQENDKDPLKFIDQTMDFDLNEHLMGATPPKLTFNTGALAGYELEIRAYNSVKKEFELIAFDDGKGELRPNENFKIQKGDTYVLHDIHLPQVYVQKAEEELRAKALAYLDKYSKPKLTYSVSSDYVYLRRKLIHFNVGDLLTIADEDFELSMKTRVVALTQNLLNPYDYQLKLSDELGVSYFTRLLEDRDALREAISLEKTDRLKEISRGNRRLSELKDSVFDGDGYFDPKNIKPLSIETAMLSVGTKGAHFIVEDLLIEPNYKGNPKVMNLSSGKLTHFTLESSPKNWSLPAASFDLDQDEALYYIYARCHKSSNQGLWHVSKERIKTEGPEGNYFFLLGAVHSVIDGVRGVSLTYGQSAINGRFITTGRIKSSDGHNFMDLDQNQFAIGNESGGMDWNTSEKDTLTIRGAVIQKGSLADWVIKEGKITSRDKSASLNSEDGKFSIVKNQDTGEKTELSKEGLYAGHAGVQVKDVHGKEFKAAVVGRLGSSPYTNSTGGFFEGINIAGALHIQTKVIRNGDLTNTDSYSREIYRQPANVGAYDVERRYIEENCYVPDKFRDLGPDIALDPFGNPIHEFNRILISNPGPDWNRAIRDRKSIIEKGGPFSSMGFPEPHDTEQKDNWVKQSTHGIPECGIAVNSDRGYIKSPGKGHIEVSGEWSSGASLNSKPAEGALGLYINDEKTPRASFSTNTAEVIARYTPSRALYRFYAKNIEINKGDKIYFKETKLAVSTIQNCVIYLKPEGKDHTLPYYYEAGANDTFIITKTSNKFYLYLPGSPRQGRMIRIKCEGSPFKTLNNLNISHGEGKTFVYAGGWHDMS